MVKTGNVKYDKEKKIHLVFDTIWRIVSLYPEKCDCVDSPTCCHILAAKHKNGFGIKVDYFKPKKLSQLMAKNATNSKFKSGSGSKRKYQTRNTYKLSDHERSTN